MFNLVVLGATGVGKTALTLQMTECFFETEHDPTISDLYRRRLVVDEEASLVAIDDTAGDPEYIELRDASIRTGDGFLIVFSVTSATWMDDVHRYYNLIWSLQKTKKRTQLAPIVLAISKCDVLPTSWCFDAANVKTVADLMGVTFVETSARTRYGVEEAFDTLIREVRAARERKRLQSESTGWGRVLGWFRFTW